MGHHIVEKVRRWYESEGTALFKDRAKLVSRLTRAFGDDPNTVEALLRAEKAGVVKALLERYRPGLTGVVLLNTLQAMLFQEHRLSHARATKTIEQWHQILGLPDAKIKESLSQAALPQVVAVTQMVEAPRTPRINLLPLEEAERRQLDLAPIQTEAPNSNDAFIASEAPLPLQEPVGWDLQRFSPDQIPAIHTPESLPEINIAAMPARHQPADQVAASSHLAHHNVGQRHSPPPTQAMYTPGLVDTPNDVLQARHYTEAPLHANPELLAPPLVGIRVGDALQHLYPKPQAATNSQSSATIGHVTPVFSPIPDVPLSQEDLSEPIDDEVTGEVQAFREEDPRTLSYPALLPEAALPSIDIPSMDVLQGVQLRPQAKVFVVSPLDQSDAPSLLDVLASAKDGDCIVLRPGTYRTPLLLEASLTIVGDGPAENVVLESQHHTCFTITAEHAKLHRLTLSCKRNLESPAKPYHALLIQDSDVQIQECIFSSEHDASLLVEGKNAQVSIQRSLFRQGHAQGLLLCNKAHVFLEDTTIEHHQGLGAEVRGSSELHMLQSTIQHCQGGGVRFTERSQGLIDLCAFHDNHGPSVEVTEEADPTIRRSELHDGEDIGALFQRKGLGTLEKCSIAGHDRVGVLIRDGGAPMIRNCHIQGGNQLGVLVTDSGYGQFQDTTIAFNGHGVEITGSSKPFFSHCDIHNNTHTGVVFQDQAGGTLRTCRIFQNGEHGCSLRHQSNPVLQECHIYKNQGHGFESEAEAQGLFESCEIFDNQACGISVKSKGELRLLQTMIYQNEEDGLRLLDGAHARVEHSTLFENCACGVKLQENSRLQLRHTEVHHNALFGLFASEGAIGRVEHTRLEQNTEGNWYLSQPEQIEYIGDPSLAPPAPEPFVIPKEMPVLEPPTLEAAGPEKTKVEAVQRTPETTVVPVETPRKISSRASFPSLPKISLTTEESEIYTQVLVVCASGNGDHQTITEALEVAPDHTKIVIRPGKYTESLVLQKKVALIGDGPREAIEIEGRGQSCIVVRTEFAHLENLTLSMPLEHTQQRFHTIEIPMGQPLFKACDISSDALACVAIYGPNTTPHFMNCHIHHSHESGLLFWDHAGGLIESCEIAHNRLAGVEIRQQANPHLKRCSITNGKQSGILVLEQGRGVIERCSLFQNSRAGVEVRQQATPYLSHCLIHQGEQSGVLILEEGQGIFEDCEIFDNMLAGVEIKTHGKPSFRKCFIREGRRVGVLVWAHGEGHFDDCQITGHPRSNVLLKEEANPHFRHCQIEQSKKEGVRVAPQAQGAFEACHIMHNQGPGVLVQTAASPRFSSCQIAHNQGPGTISRPGAEGTFEDCRLHANGDSPYPAPSKT